MDKIEKVSPDMEKQKRPWSITALSLLLLLEAVALVTIGSFNIFIVDRMDNSFELRMVDSAQFVVLEILLASLTLAAAVGFFRLWRVAWLFAMVVQAIVLYFLIRLHFIGAIDNWWDYGVMGYAVFIVLYLNYHEVQTLFRFAAGEALE